jgi:tRNA nucleotidyltransferase/poly(A) polymerase
MFSNLGGARAVEILSETGLLEVLVPGQADLHGASLAPLEAQAVRVRALRELDTAPDRDLGLAALLDPDPAGSLEHFETAASLLERLRASRASRRAIESLWRLRRRTEDAIAREPTRAEQIRLVRDSLWPKAARLASAFRRASGINAFPIAALVSWRARLEREDLEPEPLLAASEIEAAGVERGPKLGATLVALETEQLEQRVRTRDEALRWLHERVKS